MLHNLITTKNIALVFLSLISLLFLHYTFPNTGGMGLAVPTNIATWCGVALFVFSALIHAIKQNQVIVTPFFGVLVFSASLLFIPLVYTETRFLEINTLRFIGIWGGILFYFALLQLELNRRDFYFLAWVTLIGISMQAVYGIAQYYFFDGSFEGFNVAINKPYGSLTQYNTFATLLVLGTSIGLFLSFQKHRHKSAFYIISFLIFLCAVPIIPTLSRVGLLGVVVASLILLAWMLRSHQNYKKVGLVLLVLISGLFFHKLVTPVMTKPHVMENANGAGASITVRSTRIGTRTTIYPVSLSLFLQEPIKGHGIGTFRPKYLEAQGEYIKRQGITGKVPSEFYLSHPHNEVLLWAIEAGIIGLLFLFIPAVTVIYFLARMKKSRGLLMLGLMIPLVLHSLTEYPFYLSNYLWFYFICLLLATDLSKRIRINFSHWLNVPLYLLSTILLLYSLNYLDENRVAAKAYADHTVTGKNTNYFLDGVPRPETFEGRFQHEIMHLRLRELQDKNQLNAEFIRTYIYWAYSIVQSEPSADLYFNLIESLLMFKEYVKAREISAKARVLYPYDPSIEEQYFRMFPEKAKASQK